MKSGLNFSNVYVVNSSFGETVPLSVVGSTSVNVAFALPASINNYDVIVTNAGPNTAFINFGATSATAATAPGTTGTTGATPILPNAIYTFQKSTDATRAQYCAGVCTGTGTAQLYFTSVQGS